MLSNCEFRSWFLIIITKQLDILSDLFLQQQEGLMTLNKTKNAVK